MLATRTPPGATQRALPEPGSSRATERSLRLVWRISLVLLLLQLVGMLVFTTLQYDRFNLTSDFAAYSQAWSAIGHGHLDPHDTVLGLRFWRNDLELLMWPLALFYRVDPHTVTLVWLQVLAIVGGELVVVAWAREAVTTNRSLRRDAPWLLGLVTVLVLITPWSWFTIGFDFHFEPFAVLFGLLAGRDLWAGRYRRLVLWVPLTLVSCAAPGALLVIAIGSAALLSRDRSRPIALAVVLAGCGWLVLAAGLGGMGFSNLPMGVMYGYLAGHGSSNVNLPTLLVGLLTHPWRALQMFGTNVGFVVGYVASAGVIGLRSRWAPDPRRTGHGPERVQREPRLYPLRASFPELARGALPDRRGFARVATARPGHRLSPPYDADFRRVRAGVRGVDNGAFVGTIPRYIERVSRRRGPGTG